MRAHFQTYGIDKENESEFLYEMCCGGVEGESQLSQNDAEEQYPGDSEFHAFDFDAVAQESGSDGEGDDDDRMCHALP